MHLWAAAFALTSPDDPRTQADEIERRFWANAAMCGAAAPWPYSFDFEVRPVLVSPKYKNRLRRALMSIAADIDLKSLAARVGTVKDYAPGDWIFREGDAPDFMYVVLRGTVEIIVRNETLEAVGAGKALGILSLVDGERRSASARAREATQLAIIDQKEFRFMVEETPNFCWYVMHELAHRLRATNAVL